MNAGGGRTGGVPVLVAAVLGMILTFVAGWAVGGQQSHESSSALASRTLPAEQTPTTSSTTVSPEPTVLPTGAIAVASPSASTGSLPKVTKAAKPPIAKFTCPAAKVKVSTADQLKAALAAARPGSVIGLAAGTYQGEFEATVSGTAKKPIYLCGPRTAILDAGGVKNGYTLHLNGSKYWRVAGFTVQDGQKGVMLDGVTGVALQSLLVQQIGDEAVHLRRGSTANVVRGLTVRQTGMRKPKFGEGVYIGTAESNWCEVNNCQPDHSDGNFVIGNSISATTSESIDIKEGTSSGVVSANTFDGSAITGADSWVDVKGNGWLIVGNTGAHTPLDGYQVHEIVDGQGYRNLFAVNLSEVDAGGLAIHVTKTHSGNVVMCDNKQTGAAQGLTNIACRH